MERNDKIGIILLIGLLLTGGIRAGLAELESTDWITLNNTFVPISNTTHRFIPTSTQYIENFESQYNGNRAEDADLLTISEVWHGGVGAGTSFTLELSETAGNEWMTSNTGFFNDSASDAYTACYRNGLSGDTDGSADDTDWFELEFYNATGAGLAGCIFVLSGETGNPNAFVVVNGDKIYAYDDSTPVEIGDNTQEVWHTLRITSEMPDKFYTTLDGVTTGPYTLYSGVNWDFDSDGYSTGLTGGLSTAGGDADTCTVWIDNLKDSWSTTEEIRFNATSNNLNDRPEIEMKAGNNAQWIIKEFYTYTTDQTPNLYVSELGYIYRGASSESFKTEIEDVKEEEKDLLMLIRPTTYTFSPTKNERFGFIAEEVSKVDYRLADHNSKGEAVNVNTNAILALAVAKIQELELRLDYICTNHPEVCK